MVSLNQASFSINFNFQSAVFNSCHANPQGAQQALQQIQQLYQMDALLRGGSAGGGHSLESMGNLQPGHGCGCHGLPAPAVEHSGAPAGKGLSKDPAGWPQGSVQTAGGYTVVPEGNTNWSVYAPGQKHGETPHTRVWGDPHVSEKDGTRWDFTKSSDFVLPDGTRIAAQTSSEQGQSVTTGLTLANGTDKVNITGVNTGRPTTGDITYDGYQWRAQHLAANPGRDSFHLGGTGDNVKWFKESGGVNHGEVTGAHYDRNTNRYEQQTNGDKSFWVDPSLRPPLGSEAWGNNLRTDLLEGMHRAGLPGELTQLAAGFIGMDHAQAELDAKMQKLFGGFFGGLPGQFGGYHDAFGSVGGLGNVMLAQFELQMALSGGRYGGLLV